MNRTVVMGAMALVLGSGLADLASGAASRAGAVDAAIAASPAAIGELSVLTYNVHGLPWPIATDRSAALDAIGQRLRDLHHLGAAPRVAVLQEAFTDEAQGIARASGYGYAAFGPGDDNTSAAPLPHSISTTALDHGARWWKGEGLGKWTGSGLMVLSDYPIVRIRRLTYSDDACAGYDCLAAKGAMLVELQLPDGRNVEIATTHLNSRRSSGVSNERANRAWLVQAEELRDFISTQRNRGLPLVLGGDLNVGSDIVRQLGLADMAGTLDRRALDGLRTLQARGIRLDRDTRQALGHGKDWELVLGGLGSTLTPQGAWVPFGAAAGLPLSDHFGYAVSYSGSALRNPAANIG